VDEVGNIESQLDCRAKKRKEQKTKAFDRWVLSFTVAEK
jgi:hypothetical protein